MPISNARLREMVEEIDEQAEGLTNWEVEFIAGIIDGDVRGFSDKQVEVIEGIYARRC